MPKFGALGKFFGRTVSESAAFAAGAAVGPALAPEVELLRTQAWARSPFRPIDAETVAGIVAEDVEREPWGEDEAARSGVNADRFAALLGEALNAPGIGELFSLWRRDLIDDAGFEHGLRKAKLEPRWDTPLRALKTVRLTPQEVALGIVRSVIKDPGLLAAQLDTSDSNVPQYEPLSIDALKEAAASGFDRERLRGLVGEIGLPMSAQQAASARFRNIITEGAFNQAILEGDTRPEWAPFILEQARQILSPAEYVNLLLRGWISPEAMHAGAAKHGMSPDDADLLALGHGRPLSWHQVWIGLARGGVYDVLPPDADPAFVKALRESDIRPEWYGLAWAQRYSYPSAFVLRSLAQSGDLTQPEVDEILRFEGWEPTLAEKVSKRWAAGGSSAAREATAADLLTLLDGGRATEPETLAALRDLGYSDADAQHKVDVVSARRVASAKGTTITDVHAKYKKQAIDAEVAISTIEQLGVPTWAATAIVHSWALGVGAVEPT